MWQWLTALFRKPRPVPVAAAARPAVVPAAPRLQDPAVAEPASAQAPAGPALRDETATFFLGLVTPAERSDLQQLAPDDRALVSGILKRLKENRLEIPVLPQAALEISRLLGDPNSQIKDYARVLSLDPSLSVEVLRIANSAYYGFATPAKGIREALVRIGLNQVRGLLVMAHLKGKVLQGGVFHREGLWLSDLSMGLAHLSRYLAPNLGLEPEEAFTRGLLYHVEHLLILGTVGEVSKDLRQRIEPTQTGLFEAFRRFGPRIRTLSAEAWQLREYMAPGEEKEEDPFADMRRVLVSHWTGQDRGDGVAGVPKDRLLRSLRKVSGGMAFGNLSG